MDADAHLANMIPVNHQTPMVVGMKKDNQNYLQHILSTEIDSENQDWLETGGADLVS